ncbi:hypothetical protein DSM19430T_18140 [Desulfovibrio psychrotolerans]|uniref:Uncharacterized protein n=1 Tax=Desulfovibrio psychrotolerans TaxID=415242 RepID=A0A7J0BTT9_9BACT|nr:hypothetical protein DSM19430T_18140 [Desulfovibrio psychrotolerans]
MSLEISWYLRFHKGASIAFLVAQDAAPQVEHALHIEPRWDMALSMHDGPEGGLRAQCTRRLPAASPPPGKDRDNGNEKDLT